MGAVLSRSSAKVMPPTKKIPAADDQEHEDEEEQQKEQERQFAARVFDSIFDLLDLDGNGTIGRDELVAWLLTHGGFTHRRAVRIFEALDANKDARISRDEFKVVAVSFKEELERGVQERRLAEENLARKVCFLEGKVHEVLHREAADDLAKDDIHKDDQGPVNVALADGGKVAVGQVRMYVPDSNRQPTTLPCPRFLLTVAPVRTHRDWQLADVETAKSFDLAARVTLTDRALRDASALTWVHDGHDADDNHGNAYVVDTFYGLRLSPIETTATPGMRLRIQNSEEECSFCATITTHDTLGMLECIVDNTSTYLKLQYETGQLGRMRPDRAHNRAHVTLYGRSATASFEVPPTYNPGQRLLLVMKSGNAMSLVEANVERRTKHACYEVFYGGRLSTAYLNPVNHCRQGFESVDEFRASIKTYCQALVEETATLEDAINGVKLPTAEHRVFIQSVCHSEEAVARRGYTDAQNMAALAEALLEPSPGRTEGTHTVQPILVCAPPGTGKTWSCIQLAHKMARACKKAKFVPPVPMLVRVQRLARILTELPREKLDVAILVQYYAREYAGAEHPDWLMVLAQSLQLRTLVVILDGIDEAAGMREHMSYFVREVLVPHGVRVVCTSRPEGVDIAAFERDGFVIMDLKPLNEEQQRDAISLQLAGVGKDVVEHVLAVSKIRRGHDFVYAQAFESFPRERSALESFSVRDQLFLDDGTTRNPEMRQRATDGAFIRESNAPVASALLRKHMGFFTEATLARLDRGIARLDEVITAESTDPRSALQSVVKKLSLDSRSSNRSESSVALKDQPGSSETTADSMKLAVKLGLLVRSRQKRLDRERREEGDRTDRHYLSDELADTERKCLDQLRRTVPEVTAAALWPRIMARTDQMYVAAEAVATQFQEALHALCAPCGIEVKFGELKDPIRIHEKALDDYALAFDDGVIPEACVLNTLRCYAVCPNAPAMVAFLNQLVHVNAAKNGIRFSVIRTVNKFAAGAKDSTHFRTVLVNLRLRTRGGLTTFAEVQVQHKAVLKYHDESHANEHHDFFRTQLAASYGPTLDAMLRRTIDFLEEVVELPILRSLLVLVFKHRSDADPSPLPTTLFELYRVAILMIHGFSLGNDDEAEAAVFRAIACANQLARRREFTSQDASGDLEGALLEQWNAFLYKASEQVNDLPLVKVLENDPMLRGNGRFQFEHLSFQEALAAQELCREPAGLQWDGGDKTAQTLNDPFHSNMLRIGSGLLGTLLCKDCPALHLRKKLEKIPNGCWSAFTCLLRNNASLTYLDVSDNRLDAKKATLLAKALKSGAKSELRSLNIDGHALEIKKLRGDEPVASIDLSGKDLSFRSAIVIAGLLPSNTATKSLDLAQNHLDDTAAENLAAALKENHSLQTLSLASNKFGVDAAAHLSGGLQANKTLTSMDLSRNALGDAAAELLAEALKEHQSLQTLNLSVNDLSYKAARHLSKLKTNDSISSLDLHFNDLGADGAKYVVEGLNANTALTSLNLRRNDVGPEGARHIARSLKVNKTLLLLDLQLNDLGAAAAKHLSEALRWNSTLRELNLQFNEIRAEGTEHLAAALQENKTLQKLNLSNNSLEEAGAQIMAGLLKTNTTIRWIDLGTNRLLPTGAEYLAAGLYQNKSLVRLNVQSNGLDFAAKAVLLAAAGGRCEIVSEEYRT